MEKMLKWARSVLTTTAGHWQSLSEKLPVELLSAGTRAGPVVALECLQHLIDTERMFCFRLQCCWRERIFRPLIPTSRARN